MGWWGSLYRSVLSLYESIFGGVDWDDVITPLMNDISPTLGLAFALYIAFALLAMMNVITGIFVESAIEHANQEKTNDFKRVVRQIFCLSDMNDDGVVTQEEFETLMVRPKVQRYLLSMGVDVMDTRLLFNMLDIDGSGEIDAEELLTGLVRLKAGAKFVDIMKLIIDVKALTLNLAGVIGLNDDGSKPSVAMASTFFR